MKVSALPPSEIRKGLPVIPVLGARIDTTLSPIIRAARFVADDDAPDGRRLVADAVDAEGHEMPAPRRGVVVTLQKGPSRGSMPVVVDWGDGSQCVCDAEQLEVAGEAPEIDTCRDVAPERAGAAEAAAERFEVGAAKLIDMLTTLEAQVLARDEVLSTLDRRVAELEGAAKAARERAAAATASPDARFVSMGELRDMLAERDAKRDAIGKAGGVAPEG